MTFWELYDEARKETMANMDAAVNEAYILKLEERIETLERELEAVKERSEEQIVPTNTSEEQMRSFVRVLNDDSHISARGGRTTREILKTKLVRAAYGITLAEAMRLINDVTAEDSLPF